MYIKIQLHSVNSMGDAEGKVSQEKGDISYSKKI